MGKKISCTTYSARSGDAARHIGHFDKIVALIRECEVARAQVRCATLIGDNTIFPHVVYCSRVTREPQYIVFAVWSNSCTRNYNYLGKLQHGR